MKKYTFDAAAYRKGLINKMGVLLASVKLKRADHARANPYCGCFACRGTK